MVDNASSLDDLSPAERRRRRIRDSILRAAERMIADQGEERLSIRRLAEEIDYSPAAIYKYFESKEELVAELQDAFFQRVLGHVDAVRHSAEPFRCRARRSVRVYIEEALHQPHHYIGAFSCVVDPQSDADQSSMKFRAFDYLVAMVREGQALGEFDAAKDPITLAKSVWACCHGAASLMAHLPHFLNGLNGEPEIGRDAFLELHADVIMAGLSTR
ncbi:MAG: TetR/AcrR family transcriptional regulator [Pseudomonadota bacterium]